MPPLRTMIACDRARRTRAPAGLQEPENAMKRYLAASLLLSASLWVAGCQDNSATDGKIAALNAKVAQLESDMAEKGTARGADDHKAGADIAALRARLEALELEKASLEKKLAAQDEKLKAISPEKLAELNKAIEELGGEVAAKAASEEERFKEFQAMAERREKERREKQQADMQARMADAERIAKENDIPFDASDPMGSMRRIMSDPELRKKAMDVMRTEGRKQRNTNLGLDERAAENLNRIEDETLKKIQDIRTQSREGTLTPEQAQKDIQQTMADQDQQVKAVLTEEQYKKYKENPTGMGGMIPGMGDWGQMIPGMGGGGSGGGRR